MQHDDLDGDTAFTVFSTEGGVVASITLPEAHDSSVSSGTAWDAAGQQVLIRSYNMAGFWLWHVGDSSEQSFASSFAAAFWSPDGRTVAALQGQNISFCDVQLHGEHQHQLPVGSRLSAWGHLGLLAFRKIEGLSSPCSTSGTSSTPSDSSTPWQRAELSLWQLQEGQMMQTYSAEVVHDFHRGSSFHCLSPDGHHCLLLGKTIGAHSAHPVSPMDRCSLLLTSCITYFTRKLWQAASSDGYSAQWSCDGSRVYIRGFPASKEVGEQVLLDFDLFG